MVGAKDLKTKVSASLRSSSEGFLSRHLATTSFDLSDILSELKFNMVKVGSDTNNFAQLTQPKKKNLETD